MNILWMCVANEIVLYKDGGVVLRWCSATLTGRNTCLEYLIPIQQMPW